MALTREERFHIAQMALAIHSSPTQSHHEYFAALQNDIATFSSEELTNATYIEHSLLFNTHQEYIYKLSQNLDFLIADAITL